MTKDYLQKDIDMNLYTPLLGDIRLLVLSTQEVALKAVNQALISLYWEIGRKIVEQQSLATWGKGIVEQLAQDLQQEFPGIQGFSPQNLWRMRQFYEMYHANEKLSPLVREIGWTHNLHIMTKCKDDLQREFYIRITKKLGLSKDVLVHHIENQTYEKTLLSQHNFNRTVDSKILPHAKLAVQDEYLFDFLDLGPQYAERDLERELVARIEKFLQAMGGMFAFLGSQFRLVVSGKEYFIDLLLYHRQLKCLVAIELKIGEFQPEFVGKMQFYLTALDELVRLPNENASIGIILCKEKNRTVVEYALRETLTPIGVCSYQILSSLPKEYKGQLPDPAEISLLLENL